MAALGLRTAALLGDEEIRDRVIAAGAAAGEFTLADAAGVLPAQEPGVPVADIKNIGSRYGGALTAGLFLKEFVGEGIPGLTWILRAPRSMRESPTASPRRKVPASVPLPW